MLKWLTGLAVMAAIAVIVALAWLPGATEKETPPPSALVRSAVEGLPPAVAPSWRGNAPLSLAELRWCLTEEVRLEAIRPHLATQPAVDRYNLLGADFNRRCGRRSSDDEERERVLTDIAGSRQPIVADAIEEIRRLNDTVPVSTVRIQELLSRLGYEPGVVDGEYSEQTREAIEAFQRQNRIPVDGLLSPELLDHLVRDFARNFARSERCRILSLRDAREQQAVEFQC